MVICRWLLAATSEKADANARAEADPPKGEHARSEHSRDSFERGSSFRIFWGNGNGKDSLTTCESESILPQSQSTIGAISDLCPMTSDSTGNDAHQVATAGGEIIVQLTGFRCRCDAHWRERARESEREDHRAWGLV